MCEIKRAQDGELLNENFSCAAKSYIIFKDDVVRAEHKAPLFTEEGWKSISAERGVISFFDVFPV